MEACFPPLKKKKKKVIATFYLTILTFFSELCDINSQLRVKVQFWGGEKDYVLRNVSLYLTIMTF